MKIKLTKIPPIGQKQKCSICKKLKYSISDFAIVTQDGKLICYDCEKKKLKVRII